MRTDLRWLTLAALLIASPAMGQVYRWVDAKGAVHYSNTTPPAGVQATIVDPDAKAGPPSPESWECYTIRCQGELLTRAGAPDLLFWDAFSYKTYTYLPTPADPFTTTITLIRGRVSDIDRVRKF